MTKNILASCVASTTATNGLIAEGTVIAHADLGAGDVFVVENDGGRVLIFQTSSDQSIALPRDVLAALLY